MTRPEMKTGNWSASSSRVARVPRWLTVSITSSAWSFATPRSGAPSQAPQPGGARAQGSPDREHRLLLRRRLQFLPPVDAESHRTILAQHHRLRASATGGVEKREAVEVPRDFDPGDLGDRWQDVNSFGPGVVDRARSHSRVPGGVLHEQRDRGNGAHGVRGDLPLMLDSRANGYPVIGHHDDQRFVVDALLAKPVHDLSQHGVGVLGLQNVALVALGDQPPIVLPAGTLATWRATGAGSPTFGRQLPWMVGEEKMPEAQGRLAAELEGVEQAIDLEAAVVVDVCQEAVDDVEFRSFAGGEVPPGLVDGGQARRRPSGGA